MNWMYRVFHDRDGYCVRVVLYERDGRVIGYHQEPASPSGRTAEELAQDIEWFKQAFELPILTIEEIETELARSPMQSKPKLVRRKSLEELEAELAMDEEADRTQAQVMEVAPAT
ncbi:MAG: hypothetical protein ACK47M_03445 [Caldilinea sp.]